MIARAAVLIGVALLPVKAGAALPAEVTMTTSAKMEILNSGKPGGQVLLKSGEKLAVLEVVDPHVVVRYRNLTGRVFIAQTDLPRPATAPATAEPAAVPATAEEPARKPEPDTSATAFGQTLTGKLVTMHNGQLRAFEAERLAGVKFYAVYFSAGWCGPCKAFTPGLVDAYGKIRTLYPEFEVVLVSRDRSPADMAAYMRDDKMPWPALKWEGIQGADINRYAGSGIPCLVLLDENGKVLSDSYRGGRYVGPDAVLADTWKVLQQYRRSNPRPKA